MSRPRPFRVGDIVRVDTPLHVVRVGYPKCLDDFKDEAEELARKVAPIIGYLTEGEQRQLRRLLKGSLLRGAGYGGNTRSIHTETRNHWAGKEGRIAFIRTAKTGVYAEASKGYGDEYYDPPYLDDIRTHRILTVDDLADPFGEDIEVEACHATFIREASTSDDVPEDFDL